MTRTKNDVPGKVRSTVAHLLNARLADAIDLQLQVKQAHWNVKGPHFIALHELFDQISGAVLEYVDLIAERIVQLGGVAEGTVQTVAQRTQLFQYPLGDADGHKHVEALATALASFNEPVRGAIDEVDKLGDAVTVDMLTEIARGVDKWLWFVEAHQPVSSSSNAEGEPTKHAAAAGSRAS
jgi:starvation-inducible DNA-binding protein